MKRHRHLARSKTRRPARGRSRGRGVGKINWPDVDWKWPWEEDEEKGPTVEELVNEVFKGQDPRNWWKAPGIVGKSPFDDCVAAIEEMTKGQGDIQNFVISPFFKLVDVDDETFDVEYLRSPKQWEAVGKISDYISNLASIRVANTYNIFLIFDLLVRLCVQIRDGSTLIDQLEDVAVGGEHPLKLLERLELRLNYIYRPYFLNDQGEPRDLSSITSYLPVPDLPKIAVASDENYAAKVDIDLISLIVYAANQVSLQVSESGPELPPNMQVDNVLSEATKIYETLKSPDDEDSVAFGERLKNARSIVPEDFFFWPDIVRQGVKLDSSDFVISNTAKRFAAYDLYTWDGRALPIAYNPISGGFIDFERDIEFPLLYGKPGKAEGHMAYTAGTFAGAESKYFELGQVPQVSAAHGNDLSAAFEVLMLMRTWRTHEKDYRSASALVELQSSTIEFLRESKRIAANTGKMIAAVYASVFAVGKAAAEEIISGLKTGTSIGIAAVIIGGALLLKSRMGGRR